MSFFVNKFKFKVFEKILSKSLCHSQFNFENYKDYFQIYVQYYTSIIYKYEYAEKKNLFLNSQVDLTP